MRPSTCSIVFFAFAALALLTTLTANSAYAQTVTTIDVPGAIETAATAIGPAGQIAGFYVDASNQIHAFRRNLKGAIFSFDVAPNAPFTLPVAIGHFGEIVGYYDDADYISHGFVREPDGTITTFDAPGASLVRDSGTVVQAMNPAGQIVGYFYDVTNNISTVHGFLRNADGTFVSLDVPAEWTSFTMDSINHGGQIAGQYCTSTCQAFVRNRNGTIIPAGFYAIRLFMNGGGRLSGSISAPSPSGGYHGFVRTRQGVMTTFDAPGASNATGGIGCGHCSGTLATAANQQGEIVGYFGDAAFKYHAFLRKTDGSFVIFDAPHLPGRSIQPAAMNTSGQTVGSYSDGEHGHAFLFDPCGKHGSR